MQLQRGATDNVFHIVRLLVLHVYNLLFKKFESDDIKCKICAFQSAFQLTQLTTVCFKSSTPLANIIIVRYFDIQKF